MKPSQQGMLAVHSAVFIFGLTALFSKLISLSALDITLIRSVFAVLALWLFIRWQGVGIRLNERRHYAVAVLLGCLLSVHWVTYFHAMQVSSVAVGVIALFTFPVITVFLEPLFHGERPQLKDIISALAVLYGIFLLVPEFAIDDITTQGILWGVLSALLFALRNIIQGRYFPGYSASQAMFYQTAVTSIVLFPFAGNVIPDVTSWQWGQLLLLGVVFTALPHTLFAYSLLFFKAKTTSLIACLQVVYATVFAALILKELPTLSTLLGGLIIVLAAMYESYTTARRRESEA